MHSNKILNYIKSSSDKGFSEKEIGEKLEKAGYKKERIEEGFAAYHATEKKGINKDILIAGTVIIILAAAVIFFSQREKVEIKPGEINEFGIEIAQKSADFRRNEFLTSNESSHYAAVAMASDAVIAGENLCNNLYGPLAREKCNARYEKWMSYVKTAGGDCTNLNLSEEGCSILQEGVKECPPSLNEEEMFFCQSITGKKVRACKEVYDSAEEINDCLELLSFLLAMINNDVSLCESVPYILPRETCRRIVSKNETMFDDILLDIALVEKSRNIDDFSLCTAVKIKEIKSMCFDKKLSYKEIVDKVNFKD